MKFKLLLPLIVAPLFLAACNEDKTVSSKMDAGADKVTEGLKEMGHAASEKTDEAAHKAKVAIDKASEQTKAGFSDTKEKLKALTADAEVKIKAAAEDTAKAAEDATHKVQHAVDPK